MQNTDVEKRKQESQNFEMTEQERLAAKQEKTKQRVEQWKKDRELKNSSAVGDKRITASPTATPTESTCSTLVDKHATPAEPTPPPRQAKQASGKSKTKSKVPPVSLKRPFQADTTAASRSTTFQAVKAKTYGASTATSCPKFKPFKLTSAGVLPVKVSGNLASFGRASATAPENEQRTGKNLLDDEEDQSKRSLQALPEFPLDEEVPEMDNTEDVEMSDIGSDDEEHNAQVQAQLEKRRDEWAKEDIQVEAASAIVEGHGEGMAVDDVAENQDEAVDPLDAFMAAIGTDPNAAETSHQGQAMFMEDLEPDVTAVEGADSMVMTKKRKKDIPVVDHSKIDYIPIRKDFYIEPADVANMTEEEVRELRHDLDGIKVKPKDGIARPVVKWAQMGLLQATMNVLNERRYERPTPIQSQAIPIAESGRDLIGVAKTGSGKTLAFGLPMIRHILDQPPLKATDGPIGLILAPTRELADQIQTELKPFLKASKLNIVSACGGVSIAEHIAMIKRGNNHVLVATPGRLIELLISNSGRVLNFRRVTYVILDEADRMFDMGFEPQVTKILRNVRQDRQTILFSATFPKPLQSSARSALLKDPVEITVGGRSVVASDVTQEVVTVSAHPDDKVKELLLRLGSLFLDNEQAQCLIFVERQESADYLLSELLKAKYSISQVNSIYGAKDVDDRNEALTKFKQGQMSILIATSVAARGLDVPGLAMVINFDCPTHLEDYVHRCGRTGRAGKKGVAVTFVERPGQERYAYHVAKALKDSGQEVPNEIKEMVTEFEAKLASGEVKLYGLGGGFGGKGLDKLEQTRALEKQREKRAHHIDGEDSSDDEPEPAKKPEAGPIAPDLATAAAPAAPAGNSVEPTVAEPAYMRLLSSKPVVNRTERPQAAATAKSMTPKEIAMAVANKVDNRLSKKGMIHHGQPIDNKGPDAGAFHSTIEINDFPQKARWAVTNRSNVVKILDSTGVSITTKGNYYAPPAEPGENDAPKLYILVEGDTENAVTTAMSELQNLLRDATNSLATEPARTATGRFSVV